MPRSDTVRRLNSPWPQLIALQLHSVDSFPRHSHELFGVGLIDAGAQRSASAHGQVEAIAGQLISVNPGEVHDGAPMGEAGRGWRMLYLEPAWLGALRADLQQRECDGESGRELLTPPVFESAAVRQAFDALWFCLDRRRDDGAERSLALDARLQELMARLLPIAHASLAEPMPMSEARRSAAVRRARERLHDQWQSPPDLAGLAQDSGLSRFQLLRAFTACHGIPPHRYLQQLRLEKARSAIDAGLPLVEAADAGGFADQSHLSRLFKRHWGLTPGQYRGHRSRE